MKTISKKSLILVLSLVLALSALMFAFSFNSVKAVTNPNVTHFEVMEQATIRVGKVDEETATNTSGIRFRVQMDYATANYVKSNEDVELGFIITVKEYYDAAIKDVEDLTTVDFHSAVTKHVKQTLADGSKEERGIIVSKGSIYYSATGNDINEWDGTEIDGNGYYYANGAVENILEKNVENEYGYVAIGFIEHADGTYTYAYPSSDFSRTYKQVGSKAYIEGQENVKKAAYLSDIGTTANPIQITEDVDLYTLSETVATQGKTFEGDVFDLTKNLSVKNDFTKIPAEFAGTFKSTENSVKIINGGSALMHVFADETTDANNFKCTHTLFTITDESVAERTGIDSKYSTTADGFFTHEQVTAALPDATNDIGYSGNMVKWTVANAKEWAYCKINPYFTKSELQQMTQYNAVRFTYLANRTGTNNLRSYSSCMSKGAPATILSMISAAGWGSNSYFGIGGTASSSNAAINNAYVTLTIPMQHFLETYGDDGMVDVYIRPSTNTPGDLYLGDVELIEGPPIIFYDPTYARLSIAKVASAEMPAEGETAATNYATHSTPVTYSSLPSSDTMGTCPEEYKYKRVMKLGFTKETMHSMYSRLLYTASEIEELAGLVVDENGDPILDENDKKQYTKYQSIKLTYFVDSASAQQLTSVVQGAISVEKYDQWTTTTLSIQEFVELMGDNVKTVTVDGTEYTNEGLTFQTSTNTSGSTYTEYVADFERLLFLGHFSCAGGASTLYLAGIEFVE